MKAITLLLLLMASRVFAIEDTNLLAAGDWSKPVATRDGRYAIRGRLLVCDTPDRTNPTRNSDAAVFLELQEFASLPRPARVLYDPCGLTRQPGDGDSGGLHCELRDSTGQQAPRSAVAITGAIIPPPCWLSLPDQCSIRLRVSLHTRGQLDDVLQLVSNPMEQWQLHPSSTNQFYLSGTFTSLPPTNQYWATRGFSLDDFTSDGWYGTLKLPRVKIPIKKP